MSKHKTTRMVRNRRQGFALYLVAIVIAILSLGALALVSFMQTERHATSVRGDEIQVNLAAQSGGELVRSVVELTETEKNRIGGIVNNPAYFANVEILPASLDTGKNAFRFTVLSPKIENETISGIRYGLLNESTKLHLGAVLKWETESPGQGRNALMFLPGMTPSIADSILDWIDPDKTARTSGAELDYYRRAGLPYGPRNAVPVSLEELLLVRDVTRLVMFGNDESFSFGMEPFPGLATQTSTVPTIPRALDVPSNSDSSVPIPLIPTVAPTIYNDEESESFNNGFESDSFEMESSTPFPTDDIPQGQPTALNSPLTVDFPPSANSSGTRLPWSMLLTTLSAEKEVDPQGVPKYDLNESNLEYLYQRISQTVDVQAANFVITYRQTGPGTGRTIPPNRTGGVRPQGSQGRRSGVRTDLLPPSVAANTVASQETAQDLPPQQDSANTAQASAAATGGFGGFGGMQGRTPNLTLPAKFTLETPLDLLNISVSGGGRNPFSNTDPRGKERFMKLLDYATTSKDVVLPGRINVNEAPAAVLRAVPGLSDELVSQIVSRRNSFLASGRKNDVRHAVWLFNEGIVDLPTMKTLWSKLTTGGDVYRCQVVGFIDKHGTASRLEIVIDGTVQPPRQVFFKDLTMYGRGFPDSVLEPIR